MTAGDELHNAYSDVRDWLFDSALPLWWDVGGDRQGAGFFEKIDNAGQPVEVPRRTRVVGRQIYSYATASQMGWPGPGEAAVDHGIEYLLTRCLKPDFTFNSQTAVDGTVIRPDFDLYDHAFALFGLAAAARIRPDGERLAGMAGNVLEAMIAGWKHPDRGFEESVPRRLPLLANPHMHIFEACLAWVESGQVEDNSRWHQVADEVAELCLDKFLHPENGSLREFFDGDWNPMPGEEGRIVEPGHQYEWAWLLKRWGQMRNRPDAIAAARRLVGIAENYGIDEARGVAFNELFDDFTPRSKDARIWPQTERVKAWLAMADIVETEAERQDAYQKAAKGVRGIEKYLWNDVPGLWYETWKADGSFVQEHPRASTLYHITCAMAELDRAIARSGIYFP